MNYGTLNGIALNGAPASGGSSPVQVQVPKGTLTITGYAPEVKLPIPTGSITITGHAPSIRFGIVVPTGSLSITEYAPTVGLRVNASHRMLYTGAFEFDFRMSYSLMAPVQADFRVQYDLDTLERVMADHRIAYSAPFYVEHRMQYALMESVAAGHRIQYGLNTEVKADHRIQNALLGYNPVVVVHRTLYSMIQSSVVNVTGSVEILD